MHMCASTACTRVCMYARACASVSNTHTHTHTRTHARTHAHTHTHTQIFPNKQKHLHRLHCVEGPLWEFVEGYIQNGSQLFLATDNADVRQTSRAKFGPAHHDTEGSILHIDLQRTAPDVCQGFEDAVLDQLVLSRCDVIILPGSGFSRRAAMIGGAGKDVFQFSKGVFTPIDLLSMTW